MDNVSSVIEFTLSGFDEILDYKLTFFCLTLLCYCVIIMVNVVVVVTIAMDRNLYEPMYIFICNLCINGLFGTAGFYPKFLLDLLSHHWGISYTGCLLQGLVIYTSVCSDICFLAVMAYDRLMAICRPLEHSSVMTRQRVAQLVCFSWLAPLGLLSASTIFTSRLKLCGSNIKKLYCANWMVAKLSCAATNWVTSTTPGNVIAYVIILFYIFLGVFIFCSYVQLTRCCFKSLANRGKFMKTCVPHLLALFNISIASLFDAMYMRYGSSDFPQSFQNLLALEIIIGPPLFNPLIYGLTLSQIRNQVLHKYLQNK
ncbi:olfactory receptor 6N1-like [Hypomesus transpacificus]|uniref:olfactory receptor 6N1-like n=1 Tax=Hypomesus transpacificus TaxID=137520 RepID=UPI001F086DF7|nr:olfactory receptor 6N1-like [Hypomesus transpacificus]